MMRLTILFETGDALQAAAEAVEGLAGLASRLAERVHHPPQRPHGCPRHHSLVESLPRFLPSLLPSFLPLSVLSVLSVCAATGTAKP
jgi:hypothetical protein